MMRQFQLAWLPADAPHQIVLRLTSGGNHAVVRRKCPERVAAAVDDPFVTPVLRVVVEGGDRPPRVEIDYPCTLAATWSGLLRIDELAVTGESFRMDRSGIAAWGSEHGSCENADGTAGPLVVERVDLIGPCGEVLTKSGNERYSIYTTRVRIVVTLGGTGAQDWTELTWLGFNGVILGVPVESRIGGQAAIVGVVTAEQPGIRVQGGGTPHVEVRPIAQKNP
jgi:hypothetical protein